MIGVVMVVINSVLVSISSVCFKLAADQVDLKRPIVALTNKWIVIGLLMTPLILYLNVVAYRFGDISVLHPLLQLSLVWNAFLAIIVFKEKLTSRTIVGTILVLTGAVLITMSA